MRRPPGNRRGRDERKTGLYPWTLPGDSSYPPQIGLSYSRELSLNLLEDLEQTRLLGQYHFPAKKKAQLVRHNTLHDPNIHQFPLRLSHTRLVQPLNFGYRHSVEVSSHALYNILFIVTIYHLP